MQKLGASYYSGCSIPFEEFLAFSKSIGMSYVELQVEHPFIPADLDRRQRDRIVDILMSYGLTPTIHGPLHDVNLSSLKDGIRAASVGFTKECIQLSRDIGASILVLHAGTCPKDQTGTMLERSRANFHLSLKEISPLAHDACVRIAIENSQVGTDRAIALYPEEHLGFVESYKDFGVGAVLDVGHANTTGRSLSEYALTLGANLIELHLHDNEGEKDDHLPLGRGTIPFAELFETLKLLDFSGPMIVELKLKQDLEAAVHYLENSHLHHGSLKSTVIAH